MLFSYTLVFSAVIAAASASNVLELNPSNFDSIIGKGKPALVELWAPLTLRGSNINLYYLYWNFIVLHPGGTYRFLAISIHSWTKLSTVVTAKWVVQAPTLPREFLAKRENLEPRTGIRRTRRFICACQRQSYYCESWRRRRGKTIGQEIRCNWISKCVIKSQLAFYYQVPIS